MMYGKAGLPAWLDVSFCPASCPPSTPSVATLLHQVLPMSATAPMELLLITTPQPTCACPAGWHQCAHPRAPALLQLHRCDCREQYTVEQHSAAGFGNACRHADATKLARPCRACRPTGTLLPPLHQPQWQRTPTLSPCQRQRGNAAQFPPPIIRHLLDSLPTYAGWRESFDGDLSMYGRMGVQFFTRTKVGVEALTPRQSSPQAGLRSAGTRQPGHPHLCCSSKLCTLCFHCAVLRCAPQTVTASWRDFDPNAISAAIPGLAGVGASTPTQ